MRVSLHNFLSWRDTVVSNSLTFQMRNGSLICACKYGEHIIRRLMSCRTGDHLLLFKPDAVTSRNLVCLTIRADCLYFFIWFLILLTIEIHYCIADKHRRPHEPEKERAILGEHCGTTLLQDADVPCNQCRHLQILATFRLDEPV